MECAAFEKGTSLGPWQDRVYGCSRRSLEPSLGDIFLEAPKAFIHGSVLGVQAFLGALGIRVFEGFRSF